MNKILIAIIATIILLLAWDGYKMGKETEEHYYNLHQRRHEKYFKE